MANDQTLPALKPCPFCGSSATDDQQGKTYRWRVIYCTDCGALGPEVRCYVSGSGAEKKALAEARKLAGDAWNERPTNGDA